MSAEMAGASMRRFAGVAAYCSIAAGLGGFIYSILFVLLLRGSSALGAWVALLLMGGGLLTVVVLLALYASLLGVDRLLALLAMVLGTAGALGAAVHGAYDLATSLHPASGTAALPNPVDPRGFLTFGMAGLGLGIFGWLMARDAAYPRSLAYLAVISAVLLVVVYAGRLVILTATNPFVIGPAAIEGLVVNPVFYTWLGLTLRGRA